jgi:hypothetical protein
VPSAVLSVSVVEKCPLVIKVLQMISDILIREWQSLEFAQPGRKKVWLICRTNGPTSYQPSPTGWVSRSPWFGGLKARSKTPLVNHKHRDGPGFQP